MAARAKSSSIRPRERLETYLQQAEGLWRTRLVQEGGLSTGFTLQMDKFYGMRVISREPADGPLREFLTYFRPFVSEGDTIYVPRVVNVCRQLLTSDDLKAHLDKSRKHWLQAMKTAGIRLVVDDEPLQPERIMDLYLKHIFHPGDPDRAALLNRLWVPGQVAARHTFYDLLGEASRQILTVANIIKISLTDGCLST